MHEFTIERRREIASSRRSTIWVIKNSCRYTLAKSALCIFLLKPVSENATQLGVWKLERPTDPTRRGWDLPEELIILNPNNKTKHRKQVHKNRNKLTDRNNMGTCMSIEEEMMLQDRMMLQQNRYRENDLMMAEQRVRNQEMMVMNNPTLSPEQKLMQQQQLFNQERAMQQQMNNMRQQDMFYQQDMMMQENLMFDRQMMFGANMMAADMMATDAILLSTW